MGIVAKFFKLSMSVRDAHNYLIEKKGLPSWGSYAIFGMATLFLGCILGFVSIIIFICIPLNSSPRRIFKLLIKSLIMQCLHVLLVTSSCQV